MDGSEYDELCCDVVWCDVTLCDGQCPQLTFNSLSQYEASITTWEAAPRQEVVELLEKDIVLVDEGNEGTDSLPALPLKDVAIEVVTAGHWIDSGERIHTTTESDDSQLTCRGILEGRKLKSDVSLLDVSWTSLSLSLLL